jgi:hypothetical protein
MFARVSSPAGGVTAYVLERAVSEPGFVVADAAPSGLRAAAAADVVDGE